MSRYRILSSLIPLVAGVALLVASLVLLGPVAGRRNEEQRLRIERAVQYAAIQCYALEGSYPAGVDYLKEHYGVNYDEQRYFVHYWPNGANVAPDISVIYSLNE